MANSGLFVALALSAILTGTGTSQALENPDSKSNPATEKTFECQKKLTINGLPHKLNVVASLSAVRAWAERAKKYGEEYAMWHNAKSSKVKCEKFPRSDYYMCFAAGKPCRSLYVGVTDSNGQDD
ncbi:MAG: hypothetical protein ACE5FM_05160 [Methyloligellaceae bacterium]